jgi:hypothetical protein
MQISASGPGHDGLIWLKNLCFKSRVWWFNLAKNSLLYGEDMIIFVLLQNLCFRAILLELEAGTSSIKMMAAKHPVSQDLMHGLTIFLLTLYIFIVHSLFLLIDM